MQRWKDLTVAGLIAGLAGFWAGLVAPPAPARATMAELGPGLWRAELGDFNRLVAAVAFEANDIWAAGDGLVHFDGTGWRQTLPGRRPFFRAIDGLSSQALWAAGAVDADYCASTGVMYRRDGDGWRPETMETHLPLYGLDLVSATDGWAVGGNDQAVILRYDGRAWRRQVAPEVAGLRAVQALAADDVWAVGDRGAIVHFDGRSWRAVDGPRFAYLTDVHFLDADHGWAVGMDAQMPTGVTLAYRGGEWTLDSFDELPELYAVRTLAPTLALAVGRDGVIAAHEGQEWREVGRSHPGGFNPWGLAPARGPMAERQAGPEALGGEAGPAGDAPPSRRWLASALYSLAALPDRETLVAVGHAGQVLRIDDSLRWSLLHSGHDLVAIDMLDAGYGWVVGSGGAPFRWDGQAWSVPKAPASARWLRDVDVVARDDVWAVGRRGTVLHWDGQEWRSLPRFTWLDLTAVSFAGPDEGWAIALATADADRPWESPQESLVFHWDGQAWSQAIRLCNTVLTDVAAPGPGEAWFSDPRQWRVLHTERSDWAWHPIWGASRPEGPATAIYQLAAGADGALWGAGYSFGFLGSGLARLEDGVWRSLPPLKGDWPPRLIAGASADAVWGLDWGGSLVAVRGDTVTKVLELAQAPRALAVAPGADGAPEVWLIGEASTVLHYRAPSAERPAPLATVTPALPAPILHPTPTPFSVYSRDEALARALALADPEQTGQTRLDSLHLVTLATWEQDYSRDFLELAAEGDGDFPWRWESHGSLDACERGADLPVWVAELSAAPNCRSHEFIVLDGTGQDAWQLVCYPRRVATLGLPLLLRPKAGGDLEPEPTVTAPARDLTPEPVEDVQGVCPTSTPPPPIDPYAGPPGTEDG